MFVYYYIHLAMPAETATARLRSFAGLQDEAEAAYHDGEELRARLSPRDGSIFAKSVKLTIGLPKDGGGETVFSIKWTAVGTPGLFPEMEADLVLTDLGCDITQLTFRGSYRPPLGPLGRAVDRTLLHRFAETCVKGFVDRIARSLTDPGIVAGQVPAIISVARR
jgi:hypothetical protein